MLDWKSLPRPIIALSPMADMTDSPFCRVVKSMASPVVFREMVSAEAVVRGNEKTLGMAAFVPEERPIVQQIFGAEPETMAEAARIIWERERPDGIDVNMGCPVYKIVSNFNGAALMREPDRATQIIAKMKAAVPCPVTVKIRTGWSDPTECFEFAKVVEAAGADMITVHGRTKVQGYSGTSNRESIAGVKARVSIPVLCNGDIFTAPEAFRALEQTGCDGVLIARGALGNPWIFAQIEDLQAGRAAREVNWEERVRVVIEHARLHVASHGPRSIVTFRTHIAWYFKGVPGAKELRARLVQVSTLEELEQILSQHRLGVPAPQLLPA